jgi:aspartate/methionine/tyrosine aminotransferase
MALKIARRGQIPPFIAMDVLRVANLQAAAGEDVLHLEVGQPSTPAPAGVLAAAGAALARETLGYTDALGLPALREAIAAHYRHTYAIALDPARIVVTTGSSGAFLLAFLAAFEPGDRVAMAAPAYPAYRNILTVLDLVPVELPAGPDQRYQMTLDLLRAHREPLDGLIVASPANPTGTMLAPTELAEIARYCRHMGMRFISDEIYHGIVYAKTAATALAESDEAIVVNSFSKYFSMTGWRLGWMVVPPDMLRAVECLAQNLYISPPALSQHAAIAAFDCRDELDANVARYAANRALLLSELPKAGFTRFAPADGAFYLYADVSRFSNDSFQFATRMLEEAGVAATPGVDFDPLHGRNFLRLCYAGSREDMREAVQRIGAWLKGL